MENHGYIWLVIRSSDGLWWYTFVPFLLKEDGGES